MGRRGPTPQPTQLKVLRGNPGKRPLPLDEPKPQPIPPKCPAWLDAEGKREWKRVAPELERLGLLTLVDGAALAAYCHAYALMVRSARELKAHIRDEGSTMTTYTNKGGATNLIPHPAIKVGHDAARLVKAFAAEFGLTPSARTRVRMPDANDEDPFEAFLGRGRSG